MIIDHFRYLLQFSFWPLLYLDFFPWPPLIWNFWSCLTRMDLPFTNIDLQMSSWALWKAWSVCYLLKMFLSLKNELSVQEMRSCKKKSVSLLNHYCSSLVNTKMLLATSKYHPRDLKFESVGQLFMRNGNFSRKWELFNFWHISTMVWATLTLNEVDYPNLGFSFAFLIEIFIFVLFSLQFIFRRFSCWQLFSFDQNLLFQILWWGQIVPEKKIVLDTGLLKIFQNNLLIEIHRICVQKVTKNILHMVSQNVLLFDTAMIFNGQNQRIVCWKKSIRKNSILHHIFE